jgi:hypothetical protein
MEIFPPEAIIILIHGTKAFPPLMKRTTWTEPKSKCWSSLSSELAGRNILVYPLGWSGWNSFASRRKAQEALGVLTKKIKEVYPSSKQVIIGHSHGGSIALGALADKAVAVRISSVACLATPVLISEKEDPSDLYLPVLRTLCVLLIFASFMLSTIFFGDVNLPSSSYWANIIANLLTIVLTLFATTLISAIGIMAYAVALNFRDDLIEKILDSTRPPVIEINRIKFFRISGDEASALIATVHFINFLLNFFLGTFSLMLWPLEGVADLVTWLDKRYARSKYMLYIILWFYGTLVITSVVIFGFGDQVAHFMIYIFAYVILAFPVLAAVGIFCLAVRSIMASLFIGFEMIFIGPVLRITAEAAPKGRWILQTYAGHAENKSRFSPLLHSYIYDDATVMKEMSHWIKECLYGFQ